MQDTRDGSRGDRLDNTRGAGIDNVVGVDAWGVYAQSGSQDIGEDGLGNGEEDRAAEGLEENKDGHGHRYLGWEKDGLHGDNGLI